MKDMLRYGAILALICIVAGGMLASVNSFTKGKILAQAQSEESSSLKEVFPGAVEFKPVNNGQEVVYYKALDNNKFIGVVFKASGKGYSSVIETMVGMLKSGEIISVKVLAQNETPGLGSKVAEKEFSGQFSGKNAKDLAGVDAISGATISSRAVINSIVDKSKEVIELIKNG